MMLRKRMYAIQREIDYKCSCGYSKESIRILNFHLKNILVKYNNTKFFFNKKFKIKTDVSGNVGRYRLKQIEPKIKNKLMVNIK